MKFHEEHVIKGSWIAAALRKAAALAVSTALSLSCAAGIAMAGEHHGNNESKIYGTVEKLPQDRVGAWVVNGREIVVTRDTRIKEKHGKAEAGAYVEVEGNTTGRTFTADKIEVKRSKRSNH